MKQKKAEQERIRLFELEIQMKGQEFADKFVRDHKQRLKEDLIFLAENKIQYSKPIVSFSVNEDRYSFEFSDGESVKDIEFEKVGTRDGLISTDLRICLIPNYNNTPNGPQWYVVKYNEIDDFNFNPNDSTNWVKLYREKYNTGNDINDEDIQEIWNKELERLWHNSKYYSLSDRLNYRHFGTGDNLICVNTLVDAYEKGFISPSASNKVQEKKALEAFKEYQAEEKRVQLCLLAFSACTFNKNEKPEGDKLKKYIGDGYSYYFKKKDGSEIQNPVFDTELHGRGVTVYFASEQSVAMVFKQTYKGYFIFIIELDGNDVKSINHFQLKDQREFKFPSSIKYSYEMGLT